jgi:hypothetical protein
MKTIATILSGLLLLWFTFDITGFVFNKIVLVESAIINEPIDIIWWVIYIICFILFIAKNNIGKYSLLVFMVVWGCIQFPQWFNQNINKISSYNNFFKNTHHIINQSNTQLIKDTYHIILDILIFWAIIFDIVFIIKNRIERNGIRAHCT